jgi:hypothetical protein
MAKARIYRPAKNAMQSGRANSREWVLEFAPDRKGFVDNLMGWNGMTDMPQEIRLFFPTVREAMEYAQAQGIAYELWKHNMPLTQPKAYADNFRFDKVTG